MIHHPPFIAGKTVILASALFVVLTAASSRGGTVITLASNPGYDGKLSLTTDAIHVDGSSTEDVNLSDVLEADFSDTPFELDYSSTSAGAGGPLPADWKAMDFGQVAAPGTVTYADGTLTLNGGGSDGKTVKDAYLYVGRPWTGNGQWTARVKQVDDQTPETAIGLMIRDGLDAGSAEINFSATAKVKGRQLNGPMVSLQGSTGTTDNRGHIAHSPPVGVQLPVWLRLTRDGDDVDASVSSDGSDWDVIGQQNIKMWPTLWVGFFLNSHIAGTMGKAMLDQVSFTPAPSSAQILPTGVLLRSGSFISGALERLDLDPANPDAIGNFRRTGKPMPIPTSKIAVITLLPTPRHQIDDNGAQVGLIMKNGDFLAGDPTSLSASGVTINSVLLGIAKYDQKETRACVLHAVQRQPAAYEIRLKDGSSILANSVSVSNGLVLLNEVSGVNVYVSQDEIAQFRAGPAQVEPLLNLAWKATPPPAAPAAPPVPVAPALVPPPAPAIPAPTVPAPPATSAAPVAPIAPVAPAGRGVPAGAPAVAAAPIPPPPPDEPVHCVSGNNQEQIMVAQAGATVDFPLAAKFHAVALRIALAPDQPTSAQAVVRILADGRLIYSAPAMKVGDDPRFIEVSVQSPQTITLTADSPFPDTKVLFIDPVVIR